jgi:hypothetical protein
VCLKCKDMDLKLSHRHYWKIIKKKISNYSETVDAIEDVHHYAFIALCYASAAFSVSWFYTVCKNSWTGIRPQIKHTHGYRSFEWDSNSRSQFRSWRRQLTRHGLCHRQRKCISNGLVYLNHHRVEKTFEVVTWLPDGSASRCAEFLPLTEE